MCAAIGLMMTRISQPERGSFRDFVHAFRVFAGLARWRFLMLPVLYVLVGVFDSIGIALFFPLLGQLDVGGPSADQQTSARIVVLLSRLHIGSFSAVLMVIVAVFLVKFIVIFGQQLVVARIARDVYRMLAVRILKGIAHASYATVYLQTSTGYIANALTREMQVFVAAFSHFAGTLASMILVVVYLGASLLLDARITVIGIVISVGMFTIFRTLTWMSRREGMVMTQEASVYQGGIIEFMGSYKYLKATHRIDAVVDRYTDTMRRMTHARFRLSMITGFLTAIPEPIAVLLVAAFSSVAVLRWHQPFAFTAVLLLLFYRMIMRLMALQSDWNSFFATSGALRVIPDVLSHTEHEREACGTRIAEPLVTGIALHDVYFAYGDRAAIASVSLQIPKHATIALVGASGAGKSTIVDLLTGVLQPTRGHLTYDGVPYAAMDIGSLRSRFGYVTQEITMFADTILANVSLWDPAPPAEVLSRVRAACAQAECRAFVEALPAQYATHVGDRGINLSVGQRQRIAIARELYANPDIMIFDEATSALDTESERTIQQSIEALKGSKTLVLIAHRLSTIRSADYIYAIDAGRVIEEGTFIKLYNDPSSAFRRMCDLQRVA